MGHIRQHVPGFVEGCDPKSGDYGTLDELLALPWVARWRDIAPQFTRFSRTTDGHLMVEGVENAKPWWWVVGYVRDKDDEAFLSLPVWRSRSEESLEWPT